MIVAAVLQVTFYLCVRVSDSIVQMIPYVRGQFLKNPDRHFEYNYCACRHQCHFRGRRPTKPAYNHVACDAAALSTRPGVARRNSLFVSLRRAIAKHACLNKRELWKTLHWLSLNLYSKKCDPSFFSIAEKTKENHCKAIIPTMRRAAQLELQWML